MLERTERFKSEKDKAINDIRENTAGIVRYLQESVKQEGEESADTTTSW